MAGVLYVVATPIGNLEDITLRALRILKEVDLIAAEDTRHTKKLLSTYEIDKPLTSYHEFNEQTKTTALMERLKSGCRLALVSDAGTPMISDPGFRLIQQALQAGVAVVPIPGPSAITAVLSAGGLPCGSFAFGGFLPARKAERRKKLNGLREEWRTMVFYETPHRIRESLKDLLEILGDREIVLGREVTKLHEEFLRGHLSEIVERSGSKEWRGEITLVVKGSERDRGGDGDRDKVLRAEILKLKGEGLRVKEIAEVLGEKYSVSKRDVYRLAVGGIENGDK